MARSDLTLTRSCSHFQYDATGTAVMSTHILRRISQSVFSHRRPGLFLWLGFSGVSLSLRAFVGPTGEENSGLQPLLHSSMSPESAGDLLGKCCLSPRASNPGPSISVGQMPDGPFTIHRFARWVRSPDNPTCRSLPAGDERHLA